MNMGNYYIIEGCIGVTIGIRYSISYKQRASDLLVSSRCRGLNALYKTNIEAPTGPVQKSSSL